MAQYPQFPGLEFDVELTPGQITKVKAKLDQNYTADHEMGVTGWPEGKDLAKAVEMLFSQLLKGKIHVANASATVIAKMNAMLTDAVQAALSAADSSIAKLAAEVSKLWTMVIEQDGEGQFVWGDAGFKYFQQPLKVTLNGKANKTFFRLGPEALADQAGALDKLHQAETLKGAITFKLDEQMRPEAKTHRAWGVVAVSPGKYQVERAERAAPTVNGDKAPKGAAYEIVEGDKIVQTGILGQKAAFVAYAQKYPGSVNPETSLNLPKWSAGKIKAGKPFIRLVK